MKEKTREQRINAEKLRLSKIWRTNDEDKNDLASGLIERAAFQRIHIEDLEKYLNENGWTEMMQQSAKCPPYSKQRAEAQVYAAVVNGYQKTIKQLTDLLPDGGSKDAAAELMGFIGK